MEFQDAVLHECGEQLDVPRRLKESLSWEVASEVVRRHPGQLMLAELQPGGGQYDCLSILRIDRQDAETVHLNRNPKGHLNVPMRDSFDVRPNWTQVLLAENRPELIQIIERQLLLQSPSHTPETTSKSIGYRLLSSLISSHVHNKTNLFATHGWYDGELGERNAAMDHFDALPMTIESGLNNSESALFNSPAANFWFLYELPRSKQSRDYLEFDIGKNQPLLAIDCYQGTLYTRSKSCDLMSEYQKVERKIERLELGMFTGRGA